MAVLGDSLVEVPPVVEADDKMITKKKETFSGLLFLFIQYHLLVFSAVNLKK